MAVTITQSGSIGGVYFASSASRDEEGQISHVVALTAAKAGTLSTRTNTVVGIITSPSHGLSNNDIVDLYWDGGVRYGVTIDNAQTNTIAFDDTPAAGGDTLPAVNTVVNVGNTTTVEAAFDGDDAVIIVAAANHRAHVNFLDAGGTSLKAVEILEGEAFSWISDQGIAVPITGNASSTVRVSCGDATNATTVKVLAMFNSTV